MRTQMEEALASAGFDEDTLNEIATSGNPAKAWRPVQRQALSLRLRHKTAMPRYTFARARRATGLMIPEMEDLEGVDGPQHPRHGGTRHRYDADVELEAIQTLAPEMPVVDSATVAEERRYMDFTLPSLEP